MKDATQMAALMTIAPATLPNWAQVLRQKYLAGEASVFILYRNVFDRYLVDQQAYLMVPFLQQVLLAKNKDRIIEFSIDRGVRYLQGGTTQERAQLYQHLEGSGLPGIFEALEVRLREARANAIIMPYANTIFPAAETAQLTLDERIALTAMHRWSLDESLLQQDNIIILIVESLTEIHNALLTNPRVAIVEVPYPDLPTRQAVIAHYAPKMSTTQTERIALHTAGMRSIQIAAIVDNQGTGLSETERLTLIRHLLKDAPQAEVRAQKLAQITAGMIPEEISRLIDPNIEYNPSDDDVELLEVVRKRKRELIEKECAGLIEFIEPKYGLADVGGNEHIKGELLRIAKAMQSGDKSRAPMGILAVGAMGAGKTFVIKAFLKEAGLTGVALKNFRSKWVGSTESNLERVLSTVKAMGPIAMVIDEGDRSFGKQNNESDGGTSSRVIARLKEFMSDTDNRGQVLFILMTNRPDKLDTDIKRPGRLDKKIPFFYPQNGQERVAILKAIFKRYDLVTDISDSTWQNTAETLHDYSNADLEAVALLSAEIAAR